MLILKCLWMSSFIVNQSEKTIGTRKIVNAVDRMRPPRIAEPNPRYNSDPAPELTTTGSIPKTVVVTVLKIGLNRLRTLSIMAF